MRILALALAVFATGAVHAQDWNAAVLDAIRAMPAGGGYAVTSEAGARLRASTAIEGDRLVLRPEQAQPSYCSGATYLVLLKVLDRAKSSGRITMPPEALAALPVKPLRDGHGVWGRWNANGPGTAVLFHELGAGPNFTAWERARPGDFLKIFWRDAVGKNEFGHLVVYLGTETRDGEEWVRFWSSNKPHGYGEKAVKKSSIARALFSRLERPEAFARAADLPRENAYLAGLLAKPSSFAEAVRISRAE